MLYKGSDRVLFVIMLSLRLRDYRYVQIYFKGSLVPIFEGCEGSNQEKSPKSERPGTKLPKNG